MILPAGGLYGVLLVYLGVGLITNTVVEDIGIGGHWAVLFLWPVAWFVILVGSIIMAVTKRTTTR